MPRKLTPADTPARHGPIRLEFLDGIRGLTALYVALHHSYLSLGYEGNGRGLTPLSALATNWLAFGNASVAIFIVLSGFCLMLPIARRNVTYFPNGLKDFVTRRAWRILPPYYGAITVSLLLIATLPLFNRKSGGLWDATLPAFTPGVIFSHLFLVHNLSLAWIGKINYTLWTVSTEWEIYFIFALLLLPVQRLFGPIMSLVVAFALGITLDRFFVWGHFHFIGLFALGMLAATMLYSKVPSLKRFESRMPWGIAALLLTCLFAWLNRGGVAWHAAHTTQSDTLCGVTSTCFIIYCAHISLGERKNRIGLWINRGLSSRGLIGLGAISYSLYLSHALVVNAVTYVVHAAHNSPDETLWTALPMTALGSVGVAYLFYLVFEKPALQYREKIRAAATLPGSDRNKSAREIPIV